MASLYMRDYRPKPALTPIYLGMIPPDLLMFYVCETNSAGGLARGTHDKYPNEFHYFSKGKMHKKGER